VTRAFVCSLFLFRAGILAAADPPPPKFLLPDIAEPKRYAIDLTIVPGADTFRGVAIIDLELKQAASFIWLNGRDLIVDSASLAGLPARVVAAGGEFLGIAPTPAVGPGLARLEIRYRGTISGKTATGVFHRRSGADWYVFTTFTAIEARRAFPCFDEPRFKTPWELTLHVPRKDTALSNTRSVAETEEAGGRKKLVFALTEPLPSSQIGFAVGPFEIVDAGRAGRNRIPVRIVTPRGRAREAEAARAATPQLLAWLEDYTGIPYPFDKLDHLALLDGAFGAVENPGLITYRQGILLAAPEADTAERQRQMRSTMAHELAHQWFGNLVTMSKWEDVWLSEGFATWMAAKIMDREQAQGRRGVLPAAARDRVMSIDAAPDNRRVREPMASRAAMRNVYSPLVYAKGAAVLEMLEYWLGEDEFRAAIRRYLAEHKFITATTGDFVAALRTPGGRDPGPVVAGFLDQPGVPVIKAETLCDPRGARLLLRQDRYQPLGARSEAIAWRMPVCVKADGLAPRCVTMDGPDTEIPLSACPSWVFANAGAAGYYRTLLAPGLLISLSRHGAVLTAAERLSLAQDVAALVRNGRLPAARALDLLPWMADDAEPLVSRVASNLASDLRPIVPAALRSRYDRFVRSAFGVATPLGPRELELLRASQQKSLVEFLSH
jgi:alanyl aminopeptidase